MASDLAIDSNRPTTNNAQFGRGLSDQAPALLPLSSDAFAMSSIESNSVEVASSSSYYLASDDIRYNDETEIVSSGIEDTGVQDSRQGLVHSATLAPSDSLDRSGIMYFLALMMPLVSVNSLDIQWRCTPSTIIRTTEIILVYLSGLIGQLRSYVQRLAEDQVARDLFATAMDIVLVIYAIGFLFLSLYQASIFA